MQPEADVGRNDLEWPSTLQPGTFALKALQSHTGDTARVQQGSVLRQVTAEVVQGYNAGSTQLFCAVRHS